MPISNPVTTVEDRKTVADRCTVEDGCTHAF